MASSICSIPASSWAQKSGSSRSDSAIGKHPVELRVTLVDAGLHAARQPSVPAFEAVDQRLRAQPGATVTEVVKPQRLQRDAVGLTLEGEGLHDTVAAHLVKAAAECVLLALAHRDEPPAATGAAVPVLDPGVHGVRANP